MAFDARRRPHQQLKMEQVNISEARASCHQRLELPEHVGTCRCDRIVIEQDLILVKVRYRPLCPLTEESINPYDQRMLAITIGLDGQSGYSNTRGEEVSFRAGFTTITAFGSSRGLRHYRAGNNVTQMRLLVGEQTLSKYLGSEQAGQLLGEGHLQKLMFKQSTQLSQTHAMALARATDEAGLNLLAMHSHGLALLSEQLRPFIKKSTASTTSTPQDIEALEQVREIMNSNLDQPLTIPYLCSAAGINESKLKQGFHYYFQTTPHQMLHELRMRKAHNMLESGYQVAQTAYQCGYRHPSNFSAAFSRFFGYPPKVIRGKSR